MKLSEHLASFIFSNLTAIKDYATIEDVKQGLEGLDSKLQGLSDDEKVKLFEETPYLKSFTDGRVTRALAKKESELSTNFESERQKYTNTIEELRALTPEKDLEILKKEWLEAPDKEKPAKKQAYEYAKLKAEFESIKKEAETAKLNEKKAKLKELAKSEFKDRKIPSFFNLDAYIGADEEETKEKVKLGINEYDEFMKSINASNAGGDLPPDGEDLNTDIDSAMSSVGKF